MRKISLLILPFLVGFCTDKKDERSLIQNRDSIMSKYIQLLDSSSEIEDPCHSNKLLKAYYSNDTEYVNQAYILLSESLKQKKRGQADNLCEIPPEITTFGYEEAYRFKYDKSFCDKLIDMTIGRRNDSIILDTYLYQYNYNFGMKNAECRIIQHSIKSVKQNMWDMLEEGIFHTDFWGLEVSNGKSGVDGSKLQITGYLASVNGFQGKYKKIYRWSAERMAIGVLFKNILDKSGIKIDCL